MLCFSDGNQPQPDMCLYLKDGVLWARPLSIEAATLHGGKDFLAGPITLNATLTAVCCALSPSPEE